MGSSSINRKKSYTGYKASSFETLKKRVSGVSTDSADVALPGEDSSSVFLDGATDNNINKRRWNEMKKAEAAKYADQGEVEALLAMFAKRQETIKARTAAPGRKQML